MLQYLTAMVYERLRSEERGQGTVEYALILALVVSMAVAAFVLTGIGDQVTAALQGVADALTSAIP
jgi:Flp pilus assembly pilin Flp